MNSIKKVNELYKSTYLSAAKKLAGQHNDRADKLIDWGSEMGSPEKVDRDHPHRFKLSNNKISKYKSDMGGYFSIIGIKNADSSKYRSDIQAYDVFLTSDSGKKIKIVVLLDSDPTWIQMQFSENYDETKWTSGEIFYFERRKDAVQFKKYLHESISDDDGPFKDDDVNVSLININRMYTSDNPWYKKK